MREITITRTVKTFDEFSKDEQEKIVNKHYDINYDTYDRYNYCIDNFSVELGKLGVDTKDIDYCYDGYREWFVKVPVSKIDLNIDCDLLPQYLGYGYLAHLGGGIMSSGGTQLEQYKGKNKTKLIKILDILEKIAKDLKSSVDYDNSYEGIVETIEANEYEFYTDNLTIA